MVEDLANVSHISTLVTGAPFISFASFQGRVGPFGKYCWNCSVAKTRSAHKSYCHLPGLQI